jgi:Flp pilus assembly protein TadD
MAFGRPEEASGAFGRATKLEPMWDEPWQGLVDALEELGREEEANQARAHLSELKD